MTCSLRRFSILSIGIALLSPCVVACELCQQMACTICPVVPADDPDPLVAPQFISTRPGWPQAKKGDPVYLTYSYQNMFDGGLLDPAGNPVPESQIRTAIEEALAVWAEVAPLHFTEVPDDGLAYGQSTAFGTIRFRHVYINGPDPATGNPTTKAVARFPGNSLANGDVDFDHGDPWALVGTTREPDILGAAIHEVGHALGLTHTNVTTANMYWIFKRHTGPGSGELEPDDIAAIQSIYGPGSGSVTPLVQVPEPAALALGAMAVLCALVNRARRERLD